MYFFSHYFGAAMLRRAFSVIILGSLMTSSALATNIIDQFTKEENKRHEAYSKKKPHTDFTGEWQGTCKDDDGSTGTMSIKIKNTQSEIQLNGHSYQIGLLTTRSTAKRQLTDYEHRHFYWNTTNDKLLLQEVSVWSRYGHSKNNSNFGTQVSNSIISLNEDKLQIRGVSFEFNDTNDESPQQNGYSHTVICTLSKVK